MLKNIKKMMVVFAILFLLISTTCLAATTNSEKAKLEIVENNICTINISNTAIFEKKIVDYDLTKKEITLQLKVSNITEPLFNKPTEIFLVIDNSTSMHEKVSTDVTRLKAVTDSAKKLASALLENENVSIGIVSFSTGKEEGTITDATLKTKPTHNEEAVLSAITEIANGTLGARTNIDAGLTLANQNFSKDCECKYLVLLTDGVPNTAIGGPTLTYSAETATKTKAKLQSLNDSGVTIFSVMTGVTNATETQTNLTYKQLAEEIFGTPTSPTVGKFYYINDSEIEETICETVLNNFIDTSANTLTNLKIYDYFPQEIVDNFDFEYVQSPNMGNISPTIDLQNNMIIWTISKLDPEETATVSYKLTLKPQIDETILNVVLNTNEKVEITADEIVTEDGSNVLTSKVSPKVRVTMEDTTVTKKEIPQTGSTSTLMIVFTIIMVATVIFGIRYYSLSKKIK